jgi:hypothetical protein
MHRNARTNMGNLLKRRRVFVKADTGGGLAG